MAIPLLLPIIGYSVLSVLVSYVAIRLYRSRGAYSNVLPNPVSSSKLGRITWWDCRRLLTWTWPTSSKKSKPSKHITVDLLPITGLPPPPTALPIIPITPPPVDISSASIPRTPSSPSSFYQHINKQIHSLHPTSFPRPPSPHALLATTSPQKHPRRSRSLGGVPVRRLSGGASGLRNVQFLDRDIEMQKMDRSTSKEHLLIDFSSSGSSDELDVLRRESEEEGVVSKRISPASSDIGVLPSHCRPFLFDDAEVPLVDLALGRKVFPLVDLCDVEDSLCVKKKEEDMWKWFVPPVSGKIHLKPLESTPVSMVKPISKSISEPLPTTSLPLPMSEGILIDFHSEPDQEHVLVDLDVQDDSNVPQQGQHDFVRVHTTLVDLDAAVSKPPVTVDKGVVSLDDPPIFRSALEGRRSLDSLMKPITIVDITIPDPISVEISSSSLEESSQRGREVDRHPLEEVHEEVKAVPEKAKASPATIEDKIQDHEELVNEHELYDHHNDNYAFDKHHHHDSPQSLDTIRASSSSLQVATIRVQAAPAWYWDHEDDPWNGVVVVNKDGGRETEGAEDLRGEVEKGDEKGVDLVEADLEVGEDKDVMKTSPGSKALELSRSVERSLEVPTETEDEQSYPDPDYFSLPELLLGPSSPAVATEIPLVLVEDGPPSIFQGNVGNQNDQDDLQQSKDDEISPRRGAAQMPTPPASPPPTPSLRFKSLGGELPLTSLSPLSTPQSTSLKLGPSLVLTPSNTASLSPTIEIKMKGPGEDKENARVDKGDESPNSATGRPLWSIRAGDAPALGLAASSLSSTTLSAGLIPDVGINMCGSPRMRRVLGDVTTIVENDEREDKVKEDMLKDKKDEVKESSLPGAFPELVKRTNSSDTDIIVAPTITIAALTSTLLTASIAATSSISSTSTPTSSTTALEISPPMIKRRPIVRSPLDIALAMQLRPGLGVGADPAWMVRFLMAMFGWFAILVSGQGEFLSA